MSKKSAGRTLHSGRIFF